MAKKLNQTKRSYDLQRKNQEEERLKHEPLEIPKASAGRFLNKPKNPNRFKNKKK